MCRDAGVEQDQASSAESEGRLTGWALNFFTIWTGQALSLIGSRMGGFALVWWLTPLEFSSGSPLVAR
ncbi:MAG: hypothetical protein ACP5JG_18685 [Anaerolineae bacterium]